MNVFISLAIVFISVIFGKSALANNSLPDINVAELERFALAEQIPNMAGFDIRARKFVIPANTKIVEHAHNVRPGIVYVQSGEITEYRGSLARVLKAGDSLVEDAQTVHSYHNQSTKECVLIAFDLPETVTTKH